MLIERRLSNDFRIEKSTWIILVLHVYIVSMSRHNIIKDLISISISHWVAIILLTKKITGGKDINCHDTCKGPIECSSSQTLFHERWWGHLQVTTNNKLNQRVRELSTFWNQMDGIHFSVVMCKTFFWTRHQPKMTSIWGDHNNKCWLYYHGKFGSHIYQ